MNLTCTVCGTTHDYKAVVEFPVHCNTCGKGFTPKGDSYDRAVASYEMWKNSTPKSVPVLPSTDQDDRRRCPSGHLWYELEGMSKCTDVECPAHPVKRETKSTRAQTVPGLPTPRARTIRPQIPGATRERVQYLALDEMEVEAIERIQAMVGTNRDYPDRNRDILLIGMAERLERIENLLMEIELKKDKE